MPLAKRKVNHERKRLYLPNNKINHILSKITLWYDDYHPTCIDQFYYDMVSTIERILRDNQYTARRRTTRPKVKQYSNDSVAGTHENPKNST